MLKLLAMFPLAQVVLPLPPVDPPPPIPRRVEVVQPQEVRALPGQLDEVPVFNSNSPELIQSEGILLSTFPADGMRVPSAHLDYAFEGRFDIFAHHIARGVSPIDRRTRYLGILLYNPSRDPVTIDILQAVSYLSQEAPFHDLPAYVANPLGTVYSGPGSRTMNDMLRGRRQPYFPAQVVVPPRRMYLLFNAPIPLRRLNYSPVNGAILPDRTPLMPPASAATPPSANTTTQQSADASSSEALSINRPIPINGRSLLMHLSSDGPVYAASLAMYAPQNPDGTERAPSQVEWQRLLTEGKLVEPRDRPPTPPNVRSLARFYYGRVAGVAQGSEWTTQLTDSEEVDYLSIPAPGEALSYVLSTVDRNTFGTGQIQSAPILARYPDTAYRAHGNYGIEYNLSIPLFNNTDETQRVVLLFQTPLQDESEDQLRFLDPPAEQIFFRGTIRLRYNDDMGITETRYLHLVQRRGQRGQPLVRLTLPKGDRRLVELSFLYPPDATPPQVITVQTLEERRE
jgi:hypothetical protein